MTTAERCGAWVSDFRARLGLTQETLGERIGSDCPRISRIENGKENPTIETIDRLTAALNVDVSALFAPRPESETGDVGRRQGSEFLSQLVTEAAAADGSWQADVAQAIITLGGALKRDRDRNETDSETPAPGRRAVADR